jgi:iron complex transport system ATP-binding protein
MLDHAKAGSPVGGGMPLVPLGVGSTPVTSLGTRDPVHSQDVHSQDVLSEGVHSEAGIVAVAAGASIVASEPMFRCQDLTVRLGSATVLQSLDLRAVAGEWIGLLGPNGAGKSSALRALAGMLRTQGSSVEVTGTVEVAGRSLNKLDRKSVGRLIAVVPQAPVIPVGMSVFDYALLGRTPHLGWFGRPGAADRDVVTRLLDRLDLAHLTNRPLTSLSGGERQRAVIARALAQQAPVLLLDEPTSALDVGHQQQVLELVDELRVQHGLVVISAMHDLTLAGQYAHHLVLLVKGIGVGCGSPAEVLIAEVLERHYNARLRSVHSPDGRIAVVPTR